jgi:hypothetical protein
MLLDAEVGLDAMMFAAGLHGYRMLVSFRFVPGISSPKLKEPVQSCINSGWTGP